MLKGQADRIEVIVQKDRMNDFRSYETTQRSRMPERTTTQVVVTFPFKSWNVLLCRGVDIMQVDSQGRGLEHYARDSWRMTEQEKVVSSLLLQ